MLRNLIYFFHSLNTNYETINKICLRIYYHLKAMAIKIINIWFENSAVVSYIIEKGLKIEIVF